jgi:hypothetical protein
VDKRINARREPLYYRPLHQSNAELQESLRSGCSFCTALGYDEDAFEGDEVNVDDLGGYVTLRILVQTQGAKQKDKRTFQLLKARNGRELLPVNQQACAATNTGDNLVLNLVHGWMSRCKDHHQRCKWKQQPPIYPTRLLDIGGNVIRLVQTRNCHITGQYATLSHTWGEEQVKVLTARTLPDFCNGIHIDEMPQTFRDAIHIARHLSIRYLWIDCYCILQSECDRNEDQQHEIAEMDEVYSNTVINIGADAATSSLDGCFVSRVPTPWVHIRFTPASRSMTDEYLLYDGEEIGKAYSEYFRPRMSSVFRRVWCLQERILCPRMVHFGRSGVFWECDEIRFASDSIPFPYVGYYPPLFSLGTQQQGAREFDWRDIVAQYTDMGLSRPTEDKLAACGGVAKRIANLTSDVYIAGFFRQDLIGASRGRGPSREGVKEPDSGVHHHGTSP